LSKPAHQLSRNPTVCMSVSTACSVLNGGYLSRHANAFIQNFYIEHAFVISVCNLFKNSMWYKVALRSIGLK